MKKIFTFCAAVLASVSMWAESVTFSATEMSETAAGVTKGKVTALCPTKAGDQQWYKDESSTIKGKAISISSSADTAVIVPAAGKSLHFRIADGYTITGISIEAAANKDSICGEPIVIWTDAVNHTPAYVGTIEAPARNATSKPAAINVANIPEGATAFAVYRRIKYNSSTREIGTGSNFGRSQQTWNIFNVTVEYKANCTDPEAHLAFTQSTAYVGEQFSYDFGSKSGGDLNDYYTLNGVPAVKGTDYTFTSGNITVLKAGQFVMHMTVGAVGDYCAADLSDTILINEATPVAACAIEGPATAYIGQAVTFTATAANASDYAWTVNGVDANTNAAEFTYTPAAAGEYSIVCSARNKFNAANEWIASEPIALNVTKLCGDLITATLNGGSSATMGGVVGGTFDTNLGSGKYKVDKGVYIGVKLASGTFMAGDVVTTTMSTAG